MGATLGVDHASPGPFTDLSAHAASVDALPDDIPGLVRAIQGFMIHPFHAHRYGFAIPAERHAELQIRSAAGQLERVLEMDSAPLEQQRPPERRVVGNCRHFATMLTALLRHRGVAARARCGFGAYFTPGKLEDHWVCEVRGADSDAWVLVDAQIDDVQRRGMGIEVDTLDLGREDFWVAGQAWAGCRRGDVDPQACGILDMWGLWFVRGNVVRDLASLSKAELLPWDSWGLAAAPDDHFDEADNTLLDRVSVCEAARPPDASEIQKLYSDERLRVPSTIVSFVNGVPTAVELPELGGTG